MPTATILAARDATAHRARVRAVLTLAAAGILTRDYPVDGAVSAALEALNVKAPEHYLDLDHYAAALVDLDQRARALDEDRLEEFYDADEVARGTQHHGGRDAYRELLVDRTEEALGYLVGASFPGPTPITG